MLANTEFVDCFQNVEGNVWIKNILSGVLKLDSFWNTNKTKDLYADPVLNAQNYTQGKY